MAKRLRYELVLILVIAVAAFLQVFQPIRLVRASDQLANVYATYTVQKPLGHTQRARERLRREIISKLMEEELFGVQVSFPTDREIRVRLEVTSADSERDVQMATSALKQVLADRFGKVSEPVVDTAGLPDRPIVQVGPVGLFPLRFHVRRGLDLQGGTHLSLQLRQQTARAEIELAPDDATALQQIQAIDLEGLSGGTSSSSAKKAEGGGSQKPAADKQQKGDSATSAGKKQGEDEKKQALPSDKQKKEASTPKDDSPSEEKKEKTEDKSAGAQTAGKDPGEKGQEEAKQAAEPQTKEKAEGGKQQEKTGGSADTDEKEAPAPSADELDEGQLKLEDALRLLLPKSGLTNYYFETVGVRIVAVYTMAKGETERDEHARRVLSVLKEHFPAARVSKVEAQNLVSDDPMQLVGQVMEIVRRRVDRIGVAEAQVQTQGRDRIVVQLPGIKDPEEAISLLGTTAQLEFRKIPEKYKVEVEKDPATGKETVRFIDSKTQQDTPTDIVHHEGELVMTGVHLKPGSAAVAFDQFTSPVVNLQLTSEGARLFDAFAARNYEKYLGIYLDRDIISAPIMRARRFGGRVQISGGFENVEEAKNLKVLLNAGALPVPVDVVEQRSVSPTLGSDTVRNSFVAGVGGLLLVGLFMILWYQVPGLLADMALIIYIILTLALLVGFDATLTLPGIAGLILSIGMAVDANILIFERLREELRSGKTLRSAIEAGFARAWAAIIDGNLTTLLIAAVLYVLGTGPIKGFAVTLSLGLAVSLFSAVFVTKRFIQVFAALPWAGNPRLYGVKPQG